MSLLEHSFLKIQNFTVESGIFLCIGEPDRLGSGRYVPDSLFSYLTPYKNKR